MTYEQSLQNFETIKKLIQPSETRSLVFEFNLDGTYLVHDCSLSDFDFEQHRQKCIQLSWPVCTFDYDDGNGRRYLTYFDKNTNIQYEYTRDRLSIHDEKHPYDIKKILGQYIDLVDDLKKA